MPTENVAGRASGPVTRCPECARQLDGHAGMRRDDKPAAGDLTVCIYCGTICLFDAGLQLRRATTRELGELDLETRRALSEIRFAIQSAHANLGRARPPTGRA